MPRIDAVLFDLDGTLLDTAPDFHRTLTELQRRRGQEPIAYKQLRTRASDGSRAMLRLAFGEALSDTDLQPLVDEFLELYSDSPVAHGSLFSGVSELLEWLEAQPLPWGVVTNKPRYLSEKVMQSIGLHSRCSVLICPEDVSRAKPSPEGLLLAATRLSIDPQYCLYLGDHQRDIEAGREAGMLTLACGFGYLKPDDNISDWGADLQLDHSEHLQRFISELIN